MSAPGFFISAQRDTGIIRLYGCDSACLPQSGILLLKKPKDKARATGCGNVQGSRHLAEELFDSGLPDPENAILPTSGQELAGWIGCHGETETFSSR